MCFDNYLLKNGHMMQSPKSKSENVTAQIIKSTVDAVIMSLPGQPGDVLIIRPEPYRKGDAYEYI